MDSTLKLILERLSNLDRRFDGLETMLKGRCKTHYTVEEVAKITGRSAYTVRTHWIGSGHLKANRLKGGKYLVESRELERFMASGRGTPMGKTKPISGIKSVKTLTRRFEGRVRLLYPTDVAKAVERIMKEDALRAEAGV